MIGDGLHVRFIECAVEDHQLVKVSDVFDADHDRGFAVIPCELHWVRDGSLGCSVDEQSGFRIGFVNCVDA